VGKSLVKEKEYTHLVIRLECCLIKNLTRKTQWDKILAKGKEYNAYFTPLMKKFI